MTLERSFLADIVEHPDDDAPRLIFADWLDDHGCSERAEFIRVQVALARLGEFDDRREALLWRQRELLLAQEPEWVGDLAQWLHGWMFRRGFIESVSARLDDFLAHGESLLAREPVECVTLDRPTESGWQTLIQGPLLPRLRELGFEGFRGSVV